MKLLRYSSYVHHVPAVQYKKIKRFLKERQRVFLLELDLGFWCRSMKTTCCLAFYNISISFASNYSHIRPSADQRLVCNSAIFVSWIRWCKTYKVCSTSGRSTFSALEHVISSKMGKLLSKSNFPVDLVR
jgi:hypothetical protein